MLRRLVLIALILVAPALARAEARIALVIGNAAYADPSVRPLATPADDARLMAGRLEGAGFAATLVLDADAAALRRAIAEFGARIRQAPDATAVFYFSGHAVQSYGTNFLLPVDARVADAADLDFVAVDVASVLRQLGSARGGAGIVVLDAARADPVAGVALAPGLTAITSPAGTFVALAAAPGAVAPDGFTAALAGELFVPGATVEAAFERARAAVGGAPWRASALSREIVLVPRPAPVSGAAEVEVWARVYGSRDPAQVRDFLAAYPDSRFAPAARAMLASAARSITPIAPAASPPPSPVPALAPAAPTTAAAAARPRDDEMAQWAGAYGSRDPARLRAFLTAFPESRFAPAARALLGSSAAPAPAPPATAPAPAPGEALRLIRPGTPVPPAPGEAEALEQARRSRSAADYRAYLARYPDGVFAELARLELAALPPAPAAGTQVAALGSTAAPPPAVTFDAPLAQGEPAIQGRSLAELIAGTPAFPPIAGLPDSVWRGKHCSNCHQWDRAGLCTQAQTYLPAARAAALLKEHPYGTSFKTTLKAWAENDCR